MHLIVGATGKLGGAIARRLLSEGEPVLALTRDPARAEELRRGGARVVWGDLRDPESLRAALTGVRTVTAAAHAMLGRGANTMERVDVAGHRALIDAARTARVEHFLYTSIVGARPDHPLDFWRAKPEIEQYLASSGISYTILRPTAFIETHAHELIGEPFLKRGFALLFGRGEHPGISRVMRASILINSGAIEGNFDPAIMKERYRLEPIRLRDWIQHKLAEQGE